MTAARRGSPGAPAEPSRRALDHRASARVDHMREAERNGIAPSRGRQLVHEAFDREDVHRRAKPAQRRARSGIAGMKWLVTVKLGSA